MIGMLIFSFGLSWGGLRGEPRRTNLGVTYLNPESPLYRPDWVPTTLLGMLGGIIMFIAGMLFIVIFFGTIFRKKTEPAALHLPVAEAYHDERRVPIFDKFKPWLIAMAVIIVIAYVPPIIDSLKNSGPKAPPFEINNPAPVVSVTDKDEAK